MNQKSFEINSDRLMYMGFGQEIADKLHTKMDQNLAEFTLEHTKTFGKDVVTSVLHFAKGDDKAKDITFFNKFDVSLKKEGMEDLTQTFFVGPKYNYTLQERYNMMDGRAAYREQPKMVPTEEEGRMVMKPTGETYFAWRALDFKKADGYGNFDPKIYFWDHEKELQKYPIKDIGEKYDRSRIMRPLEKGNKVDVVLVRDGVETPAKVVANPKLMRLDFYDGNGQSLLVRKVEKQAVAQTQEKEMTPQEVQKAAIASAAEQKQDTASKETVKQEVAAEQQQRRKQGVHV